MFLSTSVLNNLMKKAYKTGLVVARTQDAQENDWLYLAGSYWEVSVNCFKKIHANRAPNRPQVAEMGIA